jgi:protein TonB
VASSNAAAPLAPAVKSADATRPQPVAVEIPVTINGAHNVNGSSKREPFSESTRTVLLFTHGAVVRVTTPLAPGQLVFLTNEKTKNEIVCQVVKSKAAGSNTYVELKFTEPAPGFWGLRTAATDSPIATATMPAAPKAIPPAPPVVPKPEGSKPVAPLAVIAPPLAIAPPPTAVEPPASVAPPPPPANSVPESLPSLTNALLQAAPKSVAPSLAAPTSPAVIEPPAPASTAEPVESKPPVATFQDFSKEINALFGVPMTPSLQPAPPAVSKPDSAPSSSTPSSQELKVHAAELQAKLSALLFTEAPAPSQPPQAATEIPSESVPPAPDGLANKLLELAQEKKPFVKIEPEPEAVPAPIAPKPALSPFSTDDEVKIPAWLAPLSQNSEPSVSERPASSGVSSESAVESSTSGELAEVHSDAARRSEASVFGGQLLGETAPARPSLGRSKTGLFVTLAAAAVVLAAVATWYFLYGPGAATNAATHQTHTTSSVQQPQTTVPQPEAPITAPESTLAISKVKPAPAESVTASPLPSKTSSVASSPAVFNPAPERKPSNPPAREVAPAEPQKKPALGDVHLAAPVVNRGSGSQVSGDAEPAIESSVPSAGADDAAAMFSHRKTPAAPVPVGGDVIPARLVKSVPPEYPQFAKTQHVSGSVQIDALVDTSGNVAEVKAISGPQLLQHAALDAVRKWKYTPATLNGEPTQMHLTVVVQFRAQ